MMNTMNTWPLLTNTLPTIPAWAASLGIVFLIWLVVVMILKCYTIWFAAKRGQVWWFVSLFFLNTLGILELVYLFVHRSHADTPPTPSSQTWQ